jgi:N-acetyl-alpha-D-muramate 1-phosphate uridylyltransferase
MLYTALIFSAGLGTRLYPLTADVPKALVDFGGKPLLYHALQKMSILPVSRVFVNVHHFSEKVISYVDSVRADFSFEIVISDESNTLLDTGGGIKQICKQIDGGLIAFNVDVLFDADLLQMIADFECYGSDVSLAVKDRKTSRYLAFSAGTMTGWKNVETGEVRSHVADDAKLLAFSGIQILNQHALKELSNYPKEKFSVIDFYLSTCDRLKIASYVREYEWFDVGKYEQMVAANEFFDRLQKKGAY